MRAPRLATALTMAVGVLVGVPALATADNSGSGIPATEAPTGTGTHVLPGRLEGRAAVKALGTNLPSVAKANDLSTAHLTSILNEDHTAWLSSEGRLFYQEDAPAETTTATAAAGTAAPAYSTSQTFSLHSRRSATRKIFLDFDGATVQNTAWNGTGTGDIANGTHIGFDTDGNPTTYSSSEHGFIQEVWRQVSESYAPFDVDVTTEDPGTSGITRSSTTDTTYGTQVVITSSRTPRAQVCGGCLGVAFVGTFDNVSSSAYYQPAWVFAYDTRFDPMVIAQAATHETGHTLGLQHDGTATQDYYAGTAGWGPIMGSSRTRALSQFSIGEYAGANNHEDDFAIMQSNGLPLRPDDHGSSVMAADMLGPQTSYDVSGVIGTRLDSDVFAIRLPCVSTLEVSATGIGAQS
ncbi:MAG: M12 family metallo-peptidase, partial [Marmoricola sp.]